jgi:hypothetical protein
LGKNLAAARAPAATAPMTGTRIRVHRAAQQVAPGASDEPACAVRVSQVGVHEAREEATRPVGVPALARRVEFLHLALRAGAALLDGHLVSRHAGLGHRGCAQRSVRR